MVREGLCEVFAAALAMRNEFLEQQLAIAAIASADSSPPNPGVRCAHGAAVAHVRDRRVLACIA